MNYQANSKQVGWEAKQLAEQDPVNTVISVKRMMGRSLADIQKRYPDLPYQLSASENGLPFIQTAASKVDPIKFLLIF